MTGPPPDWVERERLFDMGQRLGGLVSLRWDVQADRITWSRSPEFLLGPRPRDGYPLLREMIHPEDLELWLSSRRRTLETGEEAHCIYRLVRTDGALRWIENFQRAEASAAGRTTHVVVTLMDITARRDAELARATVEASMAEYRRTMTSMLAITREGFWLIDNELRTIDLNPAMCAILGQPREAVLGRRIYEFVDPANERVFRDQAARRAAGAPSTYEISLLRPDGSLVPCINNAAPILDEAGRKTGSVGLWTDISERMRAEEDLQRTAESLERKVEDRTAELAAREAQLRLLIDLLPQLIFVRARDGRYLMTNRAYADFYGVTPEALVGRTGTDVGLPAELVALSESIDAQAGPDGATAREILLRDPQGRERVLSNIRISFRFSAEHPDAILGVASDITEHKRQERELRLSEERLRQAIDVLPFPMTVRDRDGRLLMTNRANAELLGMSVEQMLGTTRREVGMHADEIEALERADQRARALGRRIDQTEIALTDARGVRRLFTSLRVPFRFSAEHPDAVLGAFGEITELKEAHAEVRALNAELESRVALRTAELAGAVADLEAFSYSVSHDLRAPARAVVGFAQLLIEDGLVAPGKEARAHVERIAAAGTRMGEMIDGLLRLAQIKRTPLRLMPLDLSDMARSTWELVQGTDPKRLVSFSVAPGMVARGDPALVRSVLENLLGNAFKYTRDRADARVEMGQSVLAGETVFHVRDNGAGFSMEHAAQLFGAFVRLHASRGFAGSGIGLATAHKVIERHGGRIWAEAAPGLGATFYFTLAPQAT
ncbi:MAG: PAS domain S-box protein [Burkholderiales bacterium]|nr:PAS domain S-box protein [Burkholderiales bacterium]